MELLLAAHADVGGELISAGGTGTYAINTWANEIQAGSYALMDTAYGQLGLPFRQAAVRAGHGDLESSPEWAVADVGLKTLGMDHGNPDRRGRRVWFCSDEHVTFAPPRAGGRPGPAHPGPRRPDDGLPRADVHLLGRGRDRRLAGRPARLVTPGRAAPSCPPSSR